MGRHRKKRAVVPVRTGLLGASAAMAVGAVAVASGLLPGGDTFTIGGSGSNERVHAGDSPDLNTQGGSSATPERPSTAASRSAERTLAPSKAPSPTPSKPASSAPPKKTEAPAPKKTATPRATPAPERTPERPKAPSVPVPVTPSVPSSAAAAADTGREAAAEAAVLSLVNAERAKVGCSPVQASRGLAALAGAYSEDMAARGFFSHTDPDGASPWDRAAKAGVQGLAAENIARGQADAQAVMESWMNSDGHRANILNCDYTRLGVGVHFADGGPWWTQNFGF
ncbi:CAP domain-containing protein [Streptomyces sp. WAC05374]|uniref:CAP domain-containing protein n=1 Tax=Streptomyces sp. WAC05374 TaxID=2487420 RepID=UPI000F87A46A|nr:CAP domain-containing protein [Streptomyces sp. WAC05374]RST17152.1 CAP domain-containing protein [Streptomyces sp. WAC05374]TDF38930.1 CAP domain-containing protein [Streptomyces sp. WAC05374]TDF46756.1 CAP domain-containing protein [Streptomyces sp. WAC05374]TDF48841.1 CAP domain-containing protein [Streptomyces sp. WAC05374]